MFEKERLEQIANNIKETKTVVLFEKVSNAKTLQHFASMLYQKAEVVAVFSGDEAGYSYILMSQKKDMQVLKQQLSEKFSCNGGGKKEIVQGKIQANKADIIDFFKEI